MWTLKKSGKGRNQLKRACIDVKLNHQTLKTLMKTRFTKKVILFQESLEYWDAINLCYGRQEILDLQGHVPNAQTWVVCKIVCETMLPIVKQCILNQIQSYWLVSDALNDVFSINICMQYEIQQFETTSSNFVRGDF
jgi:hypothetical protein